MLENHKKLATLNQIFNHLFLPTENTRLETGAKEPFYQAAFEQKSAVIYSREDYFSSALHEIAHWCLAGFERRKLDDFGYWYRPEGRNHAEQVEFEQVEIKPQAIEWLLSLACEHPFNLSADNLSQDIDASSEFKMNVEKQAKIYIKNGLPARATLLFKEFKWEFRNNKPVELLDV